MTGVNGEARSPSLGWAIALSVLLHVAFAGALLAARAPKPRPRPPTYRVNLIAAPPGAPAIGVVQPAPAPAPAAAPPPPTRTLPAPKLMPPAPTKTPPKKAVPAKPAATPAPPAPSAPKNAAPQPTAAGGETGGRGADVANVSTAGTEFPYPAYLQNVVRSIALRFRSPGNVAVRAEVFFLIRRDGSIVPGSLQVRTSSGSYAFDVEAQGAVEQAGNAKAFGPLPAGFADDVLPVLFSFDPRILH